MPKKARKLQEIDVFQPFAKYYTGKSERIDLVLSNNSDNMPLRGLEVKLTALPVYTTKNLTEEEYSCEIVVRPPTICFVACSICSNPSISPNFILHFFQ